MRFGSEIGQAAERIFEKQPRPLRAKGEVDAAWRGELWNSLASAGFTRAWIGEEAEGAGAGIAAAFEIAYECGRVAAPVAVIETLLAGRFLEGARIPLPAGEIAIAPVRSGDRVELRDGKLIGLARAVPFAAQAARLVVLAESASGPHAALVDPAAASVRELTVRGDTRADVQFQAVVPLAVAPSAYSMDELRLFGAVLRAAQTAGALSAALDLSVRYAKERVAFGRTISKFQAVQHLLARLADEAAAAAACAASAGDALASGESLDSAGVFLEAASAKIRAAEAAEAGAAIAHQVHGAIGFTQEHPLHNYTLRLLSWREDFGNESLWAQELGSRMARGGADALWPLIASR